jgi:hypothetical protein
MDSPLTKDGRSIIPAWIPQTVWWARQWRLRHARDYMIVTRVAYDFVAGFEDLEDVKQLLRDLLSRIARFNLKLYPE